MKIYLVLHMQITIEHNAIIIMTRTNTITIIHRGITHLTLVDAIGGLVECFVFVIVAIVVVVVGLFVVGDRVSSHLTEPSRKGSVQ